MKSFVAPLFAAALVAGQAVAVPLVQEDFSAPDSTLLVGQPGWTETPLGGVGNPIAIVGGRVTLNESAGGQDATLATGSTIAAGQTWYAGFDLTVAGDASVVNFAHFTDSTVDNNEVIDGNLNIGFVSRVQISGTVSDPGGPVPSGGFGLSIFNNNNDPSPANAPRVDRNFAFGTTYRVVISYDFDSGTSQLRVIDPADASQVFVDTNLNDAVVGRTINSFGLRQDSDGNSTVTIDNIIVSTDLASAIPEPGSLVLLSLAGLVLLRRRRG